MGRNALILQPPPEDFPNKGKYVTYSSSWSRTGYSDDPQYPGQMPVTWPEDWSPWECWLGGKIVGITNGD